MRPPYDEICDHLKRISGRLQVLVLGMVFICLVVIIGMLNSC